MEDQKKFVSEIMAKLAAMTPYQKAQLKCELVNKEKGPYDPAEYDCPECLNKGFRLKPLENGDTVSVVCRCMRIRESIWAAQASGMDELLRRYPACRVVLTLGDKGALYADASCRIHQNAIPAHVVDTTAAGDTFTGYFFAAMLSGKTTADTLRIAAAAASMAIAKPGAAKSIPLAKEVTL